MQVKMEWTCIPDGHYHRVIITEVVFIQLSCWGWAQSCSKHVEDSNKRNIEETVRQVGYLPEHLFELLWLHWHSLEFIRNMQLKIQRGHKVAILVVQMYYMATKWDRNKQSIFCRSFLNSESLCAPLLTSTRKRPVALTRPNHTYRVTNFENRKRTVWTCHTSI